MKRVDVKMVSLDQFVSNENINKIDLIKIDVDGLEFEILQGAINTIKRLRPILIIETNNDSRILDLCLSYNYIILDQDLQPYYNDRQIPGNIFCVDRKSYNEENSLKI